jgi:hypothetical protein
MLLTHERASIWNNTQNLHDYETKFMKVYSEIIKRTTVTIDYFRRLKTFILAIIISKCALTLEADSPERKSGLLRSNNASLFGGGQVSGSYVRQALLTRANFPDQQDQIKLISKNIIRTFFDRIQKDFRKVIDKKKSIISLDLMAVNEIIYLQFKALADGSDPKMKDFLRTMTVNIFFTEFWEVLVQRDKIWHAAWANGGSEHHKERLTSLVDIVINSMNMVFGKNGERGVLDELFDDQEFKTAHRDCVDTIFEAVAKHKGPTYDNSLTNSMANLVDSFTDSQDMIKIPIADIIRLKQILVKNHRAPGNLFITTEENFQEPLRTLISYLSQDEYQFSVTENIDQALEINLKIKNKFFYYDKMDKSNFQLYKCNKCSMILPKEMLWEEDRMILSIIGENGWPCFDKKGKVHNYNP